MTRTGNLAFLRLALLAMLFGSAGGALGQSSESSAQADSGWEAQRSSDYPPSYRRADSSAASWQPTRSQSTPSQAKAVAQPAPKNWLSPTQSAGRAKAVAKATPNSTAKQTAVRAPKPFVPPTDAKQLVAAQRPPRPTIEADAPIVAQSRPNANVASSAAQSSRSVAQPATSTGANSRVAPRSAQDRVAYRPKPTPTKGTRLFDDSWIRPLKQVVYQAGEPEELYAPPGQPEEMPLPGAPTMEPEMQQDGEWIGSPGSGPGCDGSCGPVCECGPMCGDGVECGSTCEPDSLDLCTVGPHDDEACDTVRIRVPKFQELMVFGGVHGFKGPYDQERDSGNFGFQEGFNVGGKLPFTETGYQFGFQAAQSQLSGDAATGIQDSFAQHFFTTGVFKRSRDGFQGGVVWDLLLDERSSSVAFSQVRGEFGFVDCGCHEIGVSGAIHLKNNVFLNAEEETSTTFQSVDQYLLYYRMHGARGGEGRIYGGLTDDADGIVGSDFLLPLTDCWSLQPGFTYLIPKDNGGTIAAREEAWNISINLVWHWRGHARSCHSSPYRPLFNVADNGYMIIDNRP